MCGRIDGIPAASPVYRHRPVTCHGHSTHIGKFHLVRIRLFLNSLNNIQCRADIRIQRLFRILIRRGRYHSSDVQHIIRACHTFQNGFVILHISPDHFQIRICYLLHKLFVLGRWTGQHTDRKFGFPCQQLFHRFNSHLAGAACYKNGLGRFGNHRTVFRLVEFHCRFLRFKGGIHRTAGAERIPNLHKSDALTAAAFFQCG